MPTTRTVTGTGDPTPAVRIRSWDDPTPIPRGKAATRPPDKRRRFTTDDPKPRKTSGASSMKES